MYPRMHCNVQWWMLISLIISSEADLFHDNTRHWQASKHTTSSSFDVSRVILKISPCSVWAKMKNIAYRKEAWQVSSTAVCTCTLYLSLVSCTANKQHSTFWIVQIILQYTQTDLSTLTNTTQAKHETMTNTTFCMHCTSQAARTATIHMHVHVMTWTTS